MPPDVSFGTDDKQNSEADAHNDGSNEVIIVEADDSEEDETIISDNVPPPSQM